MLRDTVIVDDSTDTRTHKIFHALDEVCYQFDLGKPIWLDATIAEFKRHEKARFYQDNLFLYFRYLQDCGHDQRSEGYKSAGHKGLYYIS